MLFVKDKELAKIRITHYNASFQNDISFRIVKKERIWKILISMYNSQIGWSGDKFVECTNCKSLSEAKDWCEEMAEKFAKDTGIDKPTIDAYNDEAPTIAKLHATLTPRRIYELIDLYFIKGKDTADIGCGSGRDTKWLNSQGFYTIGVDASDGMIKEAKKHYPDLEFKLDYLPALNCFDYGQFHNILCSAVLMHLDINGIDAACLRMSQLLKPKGCLILSFRCTENNDNRENGKLYESIQHSLLEEVFEKNNCEIILHETDVEKIRGLTWHNLVVIKK
jgi:2-polyprenyl-3-methyl-5-hydroxy-6-metoxy-1,4-benzoquinol methylase